MFSVTEKLGLFFMTMLLVGMLFVAALFNTEKRTCDIVCEEHDKCKSENVLQGKFYDFTEIECYDGTKLQISKSKEKN